LTKRKTKIKEILHMIKEKKETIILYESPYRIMKTLSLMSEIIPNKEIVIARELTKRFEEFIRGKPRDVLNKVGNRKMKGEITLIIK